MVQRVALQYTPCHMGGSRVWFSCPGCDRRCALLYSGENGFCCRECYDLPYRSQRCGEFDYLLDRRNNLESQLYGDLRKPMRRKKVDLLITRLVAADNAVDRFIGKRVPDKWF